MPYRQHQWLPVHNQSWLPGFQSSVFHLKTTEPEVGALPEIPRIQGNGGGVVEWEQASGLLDTNPQKPSLPPENAIL